MMCIQIPDLSVLGKFHLSPNFFTFKNGRYTTDLMGLLPALNENKST